MDDLLKRLRDRACKDTACTNYLCALLREAADELGRLRAAVVAEREAVLAVCEHERQEYLASARRCDATGNAHGGTVDTACSLACERIAAAVRACGGKGG